MGKGIFIVIDGTDGSGKKTICGTLAVKLKNSGYAVETISFPQYGEKSAGPVEEYLDESRALAREFNPYQASAFYAVDRIFAIPKIKNWLARGKIVLSDRLVAANAGHQGGKISDPEKRREFLEWLYDLEYNRFQIPRPDVDIILHCPFEIAQKRKAKQKAEDSKGGRASRLDTHERDVEHLKNADASYLWFVENNPSKTILIETCPENIELTPDEVLDKVWAVVQPIVKKEVQGG